MQRLRIISFMLAANAVATMAGAQMVRFHSGGPPRQSFRGQAGFPRAVTPYPLLRFSNPSPAVVSPRHPMPLPQPGVTSPSNGFNPSSILQPQPPSRFIFINPFYPSYPYGGYGGFYPWSYSTPSFLPYTNPYSYPYGNPLYGYGQYPEYGNSEQNPNFAPEPYSPSPPAETPAMPGAGSQERSSRWKKPSNLPASSQATVILDGKAQPKSAMANPLTVGSGLHTIVIRPQKAPLTP